MHDPAESGEFDDSALDYNMAVCICYFRSCYILEVFRYNIHTTVNTISMLVAMSKNLLVQWHYGGL